MYAVYGCEDAFEQGNTTMAPFLGKFGGWRENGLTPTATPKLLYDHGPVEDFDKLSVMDGESPISIPRTQKSYHQPSSAADLFVHNILAKAETRCHHSPEYRCALEHVSTRDLVWKKTTICIYRLRWIS
jgi:hypothetical protein